MAKSVRQRKSTVRSSKVRKSSRKTKKVVRRKTKSASSKRKKRESFKKRKSRGKVMRGGGALENLLEEYNRRILETFKEYNSRIQKMFKGISDKSATCSKGNSLHSIKSMFENGSSIDYIIKQFTDGYNIKELPNDEEGLCTIQRFKDAINNQIKQLKANKMGVLIESNDAQIKEALSKL